MTNESENRTDYVQWLVPTSYGQRMLDFDSSIVPRRGESVYIRLEDDPENEESGTFVVLDVEYLVDETGEKIVANVSMERKDD